MNHLNYDKTDGLSYSLQEKRKVLQLDQIFKPEKFWVYRYLKKKILGWEGSLLVCPKPRVLVSLKLLHKNEIVLYDQKNSNQIKRYGQIWKKLYNSQDKVLIPLIPTNLS